MKTNNIDDIKKHTKGYSYGKVFIMEDGMCRREENVYLDKEVVYDTRTKNFHIMPSSETTRDCLTKAYTSKRNELVNALQSRGFGVPAPLKLLSLGENKDKSSLIKNEIQFSVSEGKKGTIVCRGSGNSPSGGLYKYLAFYCNDKCFRINFMRFYVDGEKVNCIFNSLQYEMDLGSHGVNFDGKNFDLCYPESSENGKETRNGVGNIVRNPSISCFADSETILNNFFEFVIEYKN